MLSSVWPQLTGQIEGGLAVVEPLGVGHEHGPFEAARDREKWRYLNAFETPKRFQRWRQEALAATASGEQGAKAFIDR